MDFLKLFQILAAGIAGTTVAVLHLSGADKHKTVAGQIAGALGMASVVAQAVHDTMLANPPSPPQTATAPDAASTA
jgi:hypothetical protein